MLAEGELVEQDGRMRVLFLDLDGVLNSEAFFARQRGRGLVIISNRAELLDPAAVAHLNRIVETTGCLVVLSSSWRLQRGALLDVGAWLRAVGFVGALHDLTPRAPDTRGGQIAAWLAQHPEVTRYAILDDEPDLDTHPGRWVVTSYATGLTEREADQAIELLGSAGR